MRLAALAPAGHQRVLRGELGAATSLLPTGRRASFLHSASSAVATFRKLAPSYPLPFETMRWMAQHRPLQRSALYARWTPTGPRRYQND